MARLIDADALLKGKTDHEMISAHLVWNAPTVEAIPIEWLKRFKAGEYKDSYWSWFTDRLIEMWRGEQSNETD